MKQKEANYFMDFLYAVFHTSVSVKKAADMTPSTICFSYMSYVIELSLVFSEIFVVCLSFSAVCMHILSLEHWIRAP